MSSDMQHSKPVAHLVEFATVAANLNQDFETVALLLEQLGEVDKARQLRALDIPKLLTLPPDQAKEALTKLAHYLSRFYVQICAWDNHSRQLGWR